MRHSQGGRRLGTTAMHKLIGVKCVEWEKIKGVEVSNSYGGKHCMSFITSCYGHCLQIYIYRVEFVCPPTLMQF